MNRYRNYMDRIHRPRQPSRKLLAGAPPRRQKTKYAPAFALAAACCLLAVVGLWQPWRGTVPQQVSPPPGWPPPPAWWRAPRRSRPQNTP